MSGIKHGGVRGIGRLGIAEQEEVLSRLRAGKSQGQVALAFSVTKNIIAGIWRRHGDPDYKPAEPEPITLTGRLDALHSQMDAVLAETRGVGKITNVPVVRQTQR